MTKQRLAAAPGVQTCRTVRGTYNPVVYILNKDTYEIVRRYVYATMHPSREEALSRAQIEVLKIVGNCADARFFTIEYLSREEMEWGGFLDATATFK